LKESFSVRTNIMKPSIKTIGLLAALALGSASTLLAQVPDLTKDMKSVDRKGTYNLGATGMRGWIHTKAETKADADFGRTTGASRQILVTHVGANSPADGVMQVDDVILGIDDQPFTDDARKSIAWAIQEAEKSPVGGKEGNPKKTSSGSLVLLRWRAGKTESVALKMRVMGTYSDTAPYNCPKSAKIIEEACASLQKETNMWKEVNGLAMLATGDPRYMPQIKDLRPFNTTCPKSAWAYGAWVTWASSSVNITCRPATSRWSPPSMRSASRWPRARACMEPSDTASPIGPRTENSMVPYRPMAQCLRMLRGLTLPSSSVNVAD
jgi:hypothetical protein